MDPRYLALRARFWGDNSLVYVTIFSKELFSTASLISIATLRPTEIASPNKYLLYGVAVIPGDPGIRGDTSITTISFLGGPAVIIDWSANGPITPGAQIF